MVLELKNLHPSIPTLFLWGSAISFNDPSNHYIAGFYERKNGSNGLGISGGHLAAAERSAIHALFGEKHGCEQGGRSHADIRTERRELGVHDR